MGGGAFIAMLRVGCFLLLIWFASRLSRLAGISSIVLEITTGLILSPGLLGLFPKEYSVCHYRLIDDCEKRATLNHIQQKLAQCDYDAYMMQDGLSFSALPLAVSTAVPKAPAKGVVGGSAATMTPGAGAAANHSGSNHSASGHGSAADHGSTAGHGSKHDNGDADHGSGDHGTTHDKDHASDAGKGSTADHGSTHDNGGKDHGKDHGSADHGAAAGSHDNGHASADHGSSHDNGHGSADHGSSHDSASGHAGDRRLFAVDEEEDGEYSFTSANVRRLGGGSSKGETKFDTYEECLKMSCKLELSHECTLTPDFFSFVGHVGVALMIFESGMHFDFDKAKECGPIACAIAVLGTFLPLVFGTLVIMLLCGKDIYPEGISAGTALAPTSVGIALKLLNEAKQLQKRHGQIIITAAFVDDILSLVLFNCLFSLGAGDIGFMTFLPAILGILSMGGILAFAATYAEPCVVAILALAPKKPDKKLKPEDEVLFLIMMILLLILGTGFFFAGTHLWGCFMAGMCFAKLHFAHHVWVKQTKRVTSWMIRIFFACTVSFSIPLQELLSIEAFWKGSIMGIGPCILTKVCCAFFAGETKFVIGWAMVGRAEFAYLIAQLAASSNMMSAEVFSVVIWSLLYATIFAPFLFRKVLNDFVKKEAIKAAGGKFTKEQEEQFNQEHANQEFRQSGHLPDLHLLDEEHKKHEEQKHAKAAAEASTSAAAYSLKENTDKPVASAFEGDHHHQEHFDKKETFTAIAPVPTDMYPRTKEDHVDSTNATARGSGFLCCLFFRKIVIM